MNADITQLPDDVAQLQSLIAEYHSQIIFLKNENTYLKNENMYLEEKLRALTHRHFARKSEKIDPREGYIASLFDEAELTAEEKPAPFEETIAVKSYVRRKRGRKAISDELPRVTIEHDLPEEEKRCACGDMMTRIGEDVREQIDVIPAVYFVRRDVRYKYACKNCEGIHGDIERKGVIAAEMPETFIPHSIAASGLVADVVASKFCDHIPLYRQEKIFAREGIALSRSTLSSIVLLAAKKCESLFAMMKDDLKKSRLIGIDETTVQVLKEEGRKNTTKSWMWVFRGEGKKPITIFHYAPSRSHDVLTEMLSGYDGIIQSDDLSAYEAYVKSCLKNVTHAGCMAHARRKFVDTVKVSKSPLAQSVVAQIGKLYALEDEFRDKHLSEEAIVAERKSRALPILKDIRTRLEKEVHHVPPKSLLGKAIHYFLENYSRLVRYVDYGFVPIDNNLVENAIRPFVMGRKNWLFSGSPRGAHASSVLYSIIETAKACGHEPYWYLRYLFEKLPHAKTDEELRSLLPYNVTPTEIPSRLNIQGILETILSFKEKETKSA